MTTGAWWSTSQSTGHQLFSLSSARSCTSMITALLVQCLLQASLMGAARPANNDNTRAGGIGQSLEAAVMRPGGALVRQHSENLDVHRESFQHQRRSMLQLQQHHKSPNDSLDTLDIGDQGSVNNLGEKVPTDNLLNSSSQEIDLNNGTELRDSGLNSGTELRDSGLNSGTELRDSGLNSGTELRDSGLNSGTELRDSETDLNGTPSQVGGNSVVTKVETANNKKEEVGLAQNIEDSVAALAPGDDIKMFRTANGKVGDMEESANKLQEHLNSVDSAWGKVDGKLQTYHESVDDLGRQFQKLTESAHGVHAEVKSEFRDKEKFRMCSFENAKRVLAGEPEVDCNTMQETGE